MRMIFSPSKLQGTLPAIPSKSDAHRALICAALSDGPTRLQMPDWPAQDIQATIRCLEALGARIERTGGVLLIKPIDQPREMPVLDCGESGSTLRFLLPVAAALGRGALVTGSGRLPRRPMAPLLKSLRAGGVKIEGDALPLRLEGRLTSGIYQLPGDVSSQFVSGLLFALPVLPEGGTVLVSEKLQSAAYVDMTLETLARFSVQVKKLPDGYRVMPAQRYLTPGTYKVEGDWSNMAFFLCAGALSGPVTCTGLPKDCLQADRAVARLLARFGARVTQEESRITVSPGTLRAIKADLSQIPDLAPPLAVVASAARGRTLLFGAGRLRMKESDRLRTVTAMLRALGADVTEGPDTLTITGRPELSGGPVDAAGDHRIAMAAAIAASRCAGETVLEGTEAVEKSYPSFYNDYSLLGGKCHVVNHR
ncbi:MAG: 3-phosphoshikimate 1-carboxyvinyltransferase [Christensenellales bacterium]|jgi:3-phosphoshikimate 1-carboxyvinyltransferase